MEQTNKAPTILLVENQEDDVVLLQRAFQTANLRNVQVVRDGEQAIDYLNGVGPYADREAFPFPAILLLDLKLPKKSGLELLEWIRSQERVRRLPVIALTASHLNSDVNKAYDLGINSYLIKPTDPNELLTRISAFAEYWLVFSRVPTINPSNSRPARGKS